MAAARPVAGVHSIWELVHHITAWKVFLRRWLDGETITGVIPAEDWPAVAATTDAAWAESLTALEAAHRALLDTVEKLVPARLGEPLASEPGTTETVYTSLLGLVQHDLYHVSRRPDSSARAGRRELTSALIPRVAPDKGPPERAQGTEHSRVARSLTLGGHDVV